METLERLAAIDEIRRLKAQYFRCLDLRLWDEYRTVFAPDMVFEFPEFARTSTAEEFIPWTISFLEGSVSVHCGLPPEIEIVDDKSATGIWPFTDRIEWEHKPSGQNDLIHLEGAGHYHETYTRVDGKWKIKSLRVTRFRFVATSRTLNLNVENR